MIAKFAALICLFGAVRAGGLYGGYSGLGYASGLGYGLGGYSPYLAPSYAAPLVTKAVIPAYSYAPAISSVSRYQVHSSPYVKPYIAAPIVKSYVSPIAYSSPYYGSLYGNHLGGYSGYGYGGYGSKYLW